MAIAEMPDKDVEVLRRLLSSLSMNLGNADMLPQPTQMFAFYVAVFVYGTISAGNTPDGRPVLDALVEDVRRLRDLVGHPQHLKSHQDSSGDGHGQ